MLGLQITRTRIAHLILTFGLLAASVPAAPIADTIATATQVTWQATTAHEALILTVSGPDSMHVEQRFAAGEIPTFPIFDTHGQTLPDGGYTWEMKLISALDHESQTLLTVARANGDASAAERLRTAGKLPTETTLSGYLTVMEGRFMLGNDVTEPQSGASSTKAGGLVDSDVPLHKAEVIPEDLIVKGSACVGIDCTSTENFGFDTLRIKENNTRIKFEDTSNSPFPSNDWQIAANAANLGGGNKLTIEDIDGGRTPFTVEAGARNNSLYVDQDGEVGFGTATPLSELHAVSGNSPALRLEQDGSNGFQPQTWEVGGHESYFYIRDVTNGSRIPLRIEPEAPDNSLVIDKTGDLGLGTDAPEADLHLAARVGDHAELLFGDGAQDWKLRANSGNQQLNLINETASTTPLRVAGEASHNLLQLGVTAANRVDITGSLYINGTDNSTPDYVFEDDYELETIAEHATYMWTHKHLPAVPAAQFDDQGKTHFDMVDRAQGVLEELEKAHIYIEQLHNRMEEMQSRFDEMSHQLEALISID